MKQELEYIDDINNSLKVLREGGIILYPTDTVWGLGCDARNEEAVMKIYKIKRREDSKSMLCLVDRMDMIYNFVQNVPDIAFQLNELAIKPITIIYPNVFNLAPSMMNKERTIGVRVSREAFSKELCRRFSSPIVSTSANISGEPTPSIFSEISQEVRKSVDYIVKYRQGDKYPNQPSQIIMLGSNLEVKVIRE